MVQIRLTAKGAARIPARARELLLPIGRIRALAERRISTAQACYDESKAREAERRGVKLDKAEGDPFFLGMVAMGREILIDVRRSAA